jgi:hypothetical protein
MNKRQQRENKPTPQNAAKDTNRHYTSLCGTMEGYGSVGSGLEPAIKADDKHGPAKCKARNSNSNIKEHHNVCRAHR